MDGKRLIEKIRLRNILSFGEKGEEIELQPLNVIIGQNASGKSNLIDIFKLLRSLPQDKGLANFISKNGGIGEWVWKGGAKSYPNIEITLTDFYGSKISYDLEFGEFQQRLNVVSEVIGFNEIKHLIQPSYDKELPSLDKLIVYENEKIGQSHYFLNATFRLFKSFTDLQTSRKSEIRNPQPTDAINNFLEEDGSNLSLVLSDLQLRGGAKQKIVQYLQKFYPKINDYLIVPSSGNVQLYIDEERLEKRISAKRLSDGTLRYLCLLAILCHPEPPPLICIEEPETGLHPDILPTIAELLKEASQRTQLIVTTHSDILVSALSDVPEAVLVCEKDEDGTHFKRLNKENLKDWLNEYSLGELWLKGEIGGTRW